MAKREKLQKTNAMRELDRAGLAYAVHTYEVDESDLSGTHVASVLGQDPDCVFKTLVTATPEGGHVVCCIPVAEELDLKRAAAAAGEKSLSMLHVRDLLATTGYVRGGCSPVGMKKRFPTLIDETAQLFETIMISGGRRGVQIEITPDDLGTYCAATFADICRATDASV